MTRVVSSHDDVLIITAQKALRGTTTEHNDKMLGFFMAFDKPPDRDHRLFDSKISEYFCGKSTLNFV